MFIGREKELEFLNKRYESDQAEFIVVYGRRRVGKTELLTEFCKDKPHFFYICNEYTDRKQFTSFSDALLDFAPAMQKTIRRFADWEDLFSSFGDLPGEEKTVIVIDEFPYMCKGDKSIPSVIQNLWDHKLRNANIMLIISGSSISFIEDELLGVKNPLYGRATGIYKLEPMPGMLELFDDLRGRYPGKVEILSAVPKPSRNVPTAGDDKREWVRKYLGEDVKVNIVLRREKPDYVKGQGSILIDDTEGNILSWNEAGGTGILFRDAASAASELKRILSQ